MTTSQHPTQLDTETFQKIYDVSPNKGFIPSSPIAYLATTHPAWERLSSQIPTMPPAHLPSNISSLPPFDITRLHTINSQRRARVLLGQIVHVYVHRLKERIIPLKLSRPWYQLSQIMGLPPILTASDLDLWNNAHLLSPLSSMTGTLSEKYFHAVPSAIQLRAGKDDLIRRMFNVPYFISKEKTEIVEEVLNDLTSVLIDARDVFLKMLEEKVDMIEFYDIYRPLLGGFWPDGVVLEGFMEWCKEEDIKDEIEEKVIRFKGPSAGQSAFFFLVDDFLEVRHHDKNHVNNKMGMFAKEMENYLPTKHALLVKDFRARLSDEYSVADFAMRSGIEYAYKMAIEALRSFRARHLAIAAKYLRGTRVGTGSSEFISLLSESLRDTKRMLGAFEREN